MKYNKWTLFENLLRKFQFYLKMARITGTLYECLWTFIIIACWIPFRVRNVSDQLSREIQNINFILSNFLPENCAVHEIMWRNVVQPDRPQMTIWYSQTGHRWQYGTARQATDDNMVQPDRSQMTIWYSQTGHRWQYVTARQATDDNMVQSDRPQMTIWYSQTGHRWQYGTARQATDDNTGCTGYNMPHKLWMQDK